MENQSPLNSFKPVVSSYASIPIPPVTPPKKKHWIRRILITLVCFIVAALIIVPNVPSILNIFNHDIPPIDDSDLALQKIDLPDSVNGYNDLAKAISVMYAPADMTKVISDMSDGSTWNDATATIIVSKNAQAFVYFDQAAHKAQFQWPVTADPANMNPDTILTGLNDWRKMSMLSSIHALALAKEGKDAAAIEAALDSVRLGQKVQDSQGFLIEYLVGISMKTIGLGAVQKITNTSKLTSTQMLPYINEMNQYVNNDAGLVTAFKAEYHNQASWLGPEEIQAMLLSNFDPQDANIHQESLRGLTPNEYASMANNSYYFQPHKTQLLFADNTRAMIKNVPESCGLTFQTLIQPMSLTSAIRILLEPNVIGEILRDAVVGSLDGANRVKCEDKARVGETEILLALRAYKNTTKSLPTSIDQLVPAYLPAIPTDPFSRQPLQYSLATKTIFSTYSTSTIPISF